MTGQKQIAASETKLYTLNSLQDIVETKRAEGQTIVLTNGCFDVLHRGHVAYLEEAKRQGGFLVVAVNSDESVRRFKGPSRPLNPLEDRMVVLAGLTAVDALVPFEEDTAVDVIGAVRPDVYVKGGDYSLETIKKTPEGVNVEKYGGKIYLAPFVEGRSTSTLVSKVVEDHMKRR